MQSAAHSVHFAEQHHFLGLAPEAQIEFCHATIKELFRWQHRNQAGNTAERLRRCLADLALCRRAAMPPGLTLPLLPRFSPNSWLQTSPASLSIHGNLLVLSSVMAGCDFDT